jgi:hypothetical protein
MTNDSSNPRTTSQFEPLTFDASAAPGAAACARCGTQLRGSYHMVDESMTCAKCRYAAEAQSAGGTGAGALLRAIGFGAGAAVVGAVGYYAFVKITDIEWALLTALVGIGVGMAVRIGSRGHGGRKYQVVALVLTYFAMAGAYLPFIAAGFNEASKDSRVAAATSGPRPVPLRSYADSMAALQTATGDEGDSTVEENAAASVEHPDAPTGAVQPAAAAKSSDMPPTTAFAIVAGVLALGLLTTPVFVAFASPISGLFIAYALYRAWKTNAGGLRPVTTSGPFRLQQAPGSDASPA